MRTGGGVMSARRRVFGAILGVLLLPAAAPADTPTDEQLLKQAHVATDGPSLLGYFRQRTVAATDRDRINALIRQLGDPSYAVRERAMADLVGSGLPAVTMLRQAASDQDVEVARRAEKCLTAIERVPSAALS